MLKNVSIVGIAAIGVMSLIGCSAQKSEIAHPSKVVNVRQVGATGDGTTKDTASLQKALDACQTSGGEVVVPAGTYLTGSLRIYGHTTLRFAKGAVLQGSPDAADYALIPIRFEGAAVQGHQALLYAENASDVAIVGPGTLQGSPHLGSLRNPRGPVMVEMVNVDHLRLEDFSDRYQRLWSIHLLFCNEVLAKNLNIRTTLTNGDGIDVESTTNIRILHCDIDAGDDAIALKSGRGLDAIKINKPTENVVIEDCTLGSRYAGIGIGTEMSGGIRNVSIKRCTFTRGANAIYIKSRTGRGGFFDTISASDLTATTSTFLGIDTIHKGIAGIDPVPGAAGIPSIHSISISNATINCKTFIDGANVDPSKPLDGLTLENIKGECGKGATLANVINAKISNVNVKVKSGDPLTVSNVTGLGLEHAVQKAASTDGK